MRKRPAAAVDAVDGRPLEGTAEKRAAPAAPERPQAAGPGEGRASGSGARILRPPLAAAQLEQLGERLRGGELVAFPTETVYGLGANGLDAKAVLKIFQAKGRPLNDPCILHVPGVEQALELLELRDLERATFAALAAGLWPGPLSVVARARAAVPREVTAQTDFVAVRCPKHPVALELLRAAGVPLAAPSANRFGHISPTRPEHVLEDLGHWPGLPILDGGACGVGIESTVVKLDLDNHRVVVLRRGGATLAMLEAALERAFTAGSLGARPVAVEFHAPRASAPNAEAASPAAPSAEAEDETEAQQAPGMLLKHYAPSVPTFLLAAGARGDGEALAEASRSVLVDLGGSLAAHHGSFLKCFDLCAEASSHEEACRSVFFVLRSAEAFATEQGAAAICLADFDPAGQGSFGEALHDRLFRAASGRWAALVGDRLLPCGRPA